MIKIANKLGGFGFQEVASVYGLTVHTSKWFIGPHVREGTELESIGLEAVCAIAPTTKGLIL